jgi:hypothetical protein
MTYVLTPARIRDLPSRTRVSEGGSAFRNGRPGRSLVVTVRAANAFGSDDESWMLHTDTDLAESRCGTGAESAMPGVFLALMAMHFTGRCHRRGSAHRRVVP